MRRKFLLSGITACTLAGLTFWMWPRQKPHFLLITLDTTRADRLGCYGYSAGRTPVLDSLAASGILCNSAVTVAPVTLPAHTSLFTGLYPAETGVITNGRGRLASDVPTLAEALERAGYDTAAFVGSFVLHGKFGLDRGFRVYDDDFISDEPVPDVLGRERQAERVVNAALEWLGAERSRPFFCWVHLFDPHAPYLSHEDLFGDEFADRPYDGEIAYVDRQIGRLGAALKARGLESQTLVVVVGDHGEGLGEHSAQSHGMTLYQEALRVPLIFRHPGRLAPGRRVSENVSIVDVSPTVLDLLDLPDPRKITGRSFKPALVGGRALHSPCYGTTDEPYLINGWSPLKTIRDGRWKFIQTTRPELYDLIADPHELQNLIASEPATRQSMETLMGEFESRLVRRDAVKVPLSPAELRALASLGYAGAAKSAPIEVARDGLPDTKDMLPLDQHLDEAMRLFRQGSVDAGIGRLRAMIKQQPRYTPAYVHLSDALRLKSEFDEAAEVLVALLELQPYSRDGHCGLGLTALDQGRIDVAIPEFLQTLGIDPDFTAAHFHLGMAYLLAGHAEDSLDHFNTVLQTDRRNIDARLLRAKVLARLGRISEAMADCQKALEYAPDSAETHHNLGVMLAQKGDSGAARPHLVRAVELNPGSPELRYALGMFLLRQRQFEEAIEQLAKALELKPGFTAAEEGLNRAHQQRPGHEADP